VDYLLILLVSATTLVVSTFTAVESLVGVGAGVVLQATKTIDATRATMIVFMFCF
jgi:hypothetical protein